MGFNLEGACPAIAYIDDAGVLARPLDDTVALGGKPLKMNAGGFIGAMFAPHNAVNAEFSEAWRATQRGEDSLVLLWRDAVLGKKLRGHRVDSGTTDEVSGFMVVKGLLSHGCWGSCALRVGRNWRVSRKARASPRE